MISQTIEIQLLNDPRAQLLGYSALTTSRKARSVEARLSRFFLTIAKQVV
jgi:hypothetical protein